MKTQIDLQNVSCKAGATYLLHNINWHIQNGEKWIVFGENGSGKTTLLSLITGYKRISNGNMYLFGESFQPEQTIAYRKRIGLVSTSLLGKILRNESVLGIILSGKTGTLGLSEKIKNQDLVNARKLMDVFCISNKKDIPFCLLSKGEQQNVLLARALIGNPDILLLDEADSGLDYVARKRLNDILTEISQKREMTIVSVTHYPNEIPDFFEYCLLMKNGKIYQKGLLENVFSSDILSDFLGYQVDVKKQQGGYHFISEKDGEVYARLWQS